jgi:putative FmdB family regulatory protein
MLPYVYKCRPCCHVFTQVRPRDERNLPATCPKCSGSSTKRLFTAPILIRQRSVKGAPVHSNDRRSGPWTARFRDCSATNNGGNGFAFRGSGRYLLEGTRSTGNRIAFDIDDDVEMVDRDTTIE